MTGYRSGRARRRFYRRPLCLVALGIASCLGAAYAVASAGVTARHLAHLAPGSLPVGVEPASQTVAPGATARYTVKVAPRRLGPIGLGGRTGLRVANALPAGAGSSFSPVRGTPLRQISPRKAPGRTKTLTVTTATDTPPGTYALQIRARRPHRAGRTTVSLVISGPTVAGAPGTPPVITAPDAFTIAGDLPAPLTPGTGQRLDLTLSNQEGKDISIIGLGVQVAGVSAPLADPSHPCDGDDFSVEQFSAGQVVTLPASSAASLGQLGVDPSAWPQVSMLERSVNQDGCKSASLRLAFTGSATAVTP